MALHKGEELRFLSHLDYAHAVERMIRRANIKAAYSEGFNPHMKLSFSSALALGITAAEEYADLDILDEAPVPELLDRLTAAAPAGLEVLAAREIGPEEKAKKMMAVCNYAIYEVSGQVTAADAGAVDWQALLEPFNEALEISYEKVTPKKTKTIDIKHFIKDPLVAKAEGDNVTIRMGIGIYPEGTVKPGEVWLLGRDRYGWPVDEGYTIHREAILIDDEKGRRTPLEVEQ